MNRRTSRGIAREVPHLDAAHVDPMCCWFDRFE